MSRSRGTYGILGLACLALAGCDDVLVTAKLDPIQDDRVVGVWANPEDASDLGIIRKSGDSYSITPAEAGGKTTRFTLGRAGEAVFAQIEGSCANHVFSFRGDTRTCYQIVRLEFGENSLAFREIDVEAFAENPELSVDYRITTSRPKGGDSVTCALIESPAAELAAFLETLPSGSYRAETRMERKE